MLKAQGTEWFSQRGHQNEGLQSLTIRMATKQASVVFQSPLAVADAFPTSML